MCLCSCLNGDCNKARNVYSSKHVTSPTSTVFCVASLFDNDGTVLYDLVRCYCCIRMDALPVAQPTQWLVWVSGKIAWQDYWKSHPSRTYLLLGVWEIDFIHNFTNTPLCISVCPLHKMLCKRRNLWFSTTCQSKSFFFCIFNFVFWVEIISQIRLKNLIGHAI